MFHDIYEVNISLVGVISKFAKESGKNTMFIYAGHWKVAVELLSISLLIFYSFTFNLFTYNSQCYITNFKIFVLYSSFFSRLV